ncbi:MAG: methionyl-tRNA formyltransferase [Gammaproteobacteria bacterium]|nr:methionyl-tRNA formyltransferase [Gammaproteobacteria bacterium]
MVPLRIVFAGTPEFAARHLQAILETQHNVICVYTQPDRPAGRGRTILSSAVKILAKNEGLEVSQPISLKSAVEQEYIRKLNPDVLVVVAYGAILPKKILDIPKFGCINVHASLLPRWRGAAPIERAILAGDKSSGITIMSMDEGLDTGEILLTSEVEIKPSDTTRDLKEKLTRVGRSTLVDALSRIDELLKTSVQQDESNSCYAKKLEKNEALIDWNCDAMTIDRKVKVGIGRYPAYTFLDGQRMRVIDSTIDESANAEDAGVIQNIGNDFFTVSCGNNNLRIYAIQMPGKKPVAVRDLINSRAILLVTGNRFDSVVTKE